MRAPMQPFKQAGLLLRTASPCPVCKGSSSGFRSTCTPPYTHVWSAHRLWCSCGGGGGTSRWLWRRTCARCTPGALSAASATPHRCRSLSIQKADHWQCQAVPAQQPATGRVAADCSARSTAGHQTSVPARCCRFLPQQGDNAVTHALRCAASMLTGARHRHTLIALD